MKFWADIFSIAGWPVFITEMSGGGAADNGEAYKASAGDTEDENRGDEINEDYCSKFLQLEELRIKGVISEEEFRERRKALLLLLK